MSQIPINVMFRGQFSHSIDQKGRVSLPARFRDALNGDLRLIMTRSPFDPCLHLYPLGAWEEYERKISALATHDPHIVRFRRLYISPALDVDLDKAGRVRVSPEFRTAAELEKDVLWAGMGPIAELWSKRRWEAATDMDEQQFAEFRDKVQELIRV